MSAISQDVTDSPAAAGIGSRQWGRAYYRLSAREVLPVQTALSTGVTPQLAVTAPVTAAPFLLGLPSAGPANGGAEGATDLQRLVATAREAVGLAGIAEPRRPLEPTCDLDSCVTPRDCAGFSTRRVETPSR